jgi:hypothetical protein
VRALIVLLAAAAAWACARSATTPVAAASTAAPKSPPATAKECRACRGDWGVHGLAGVPSCNCRTTDPGKRCTDGNECQGMCVAAPDEPEREVVEAGPPARGFFVGRCSELVTVYGCNRLIERGARARGPVPLVEPPTMLCVD